ncbi:Fur family ferric uptake transcriptional regulator [Nocardioides marinisabuli]|uniref:Fur family ferric uptake transcriptional regulator n=1 Tax=Nocardioides marinisabuli TaxID=419476 RepID=A0A7Y9EXV9_9ACTN|nr:transcriptional repressor [Nocardioides marinisabuli]NYD55846.1 Fur family ferric uptake transcriptional regulator [Nocardioides marinisabuli]
MSAETTPRAFAEQGRRDTRQRRVLREHLADTDAFVTAQQLFEDLRARGDKVGLATIYRTLQAMTEAGEVDTVRTVEGENIYRMCGPRHHHHLVCRSCGRTVELDGPSVETWAARAADDHGFSDVTHIVELFGVCSACTEARDR